MGRTMLPGPLLHLMPMFGPSRLGIDSGARGQLRALGGPWRPNGTPEPDWGRGGSALVVGGPAKPLVGLVGLSSRSGPPLPSIFHS